MAIAACRLLMRKEPVGHDEMKLVLSPGHRHVQYS
jgi:hypothetical protein